MFNLSDVSTRMVAAFSSLALSVAVMAFAIAPATQTVATSAPVFA